MVVLTIRAHKRFAVCCEVKLRSSTGLVVDGLLIEMSLEGCRVSNVVSHKFSAEDLIDVEIDGQTSLSARVRWQHDKILGLRLMQPFQCGELASLLNYCRGETELKEAARA